MSALRTAGFTLIEVLVAMTILGLVLATGYQIVQGSALRVNVERQRQELAQYAEAIWYAMRATGERDRTGMPFKLPADLSVDVTVEPVADKSFDDWQATGNFDFVTLVVERGQYSFGLEGVMPQQP